ncbi:MAG: segregation/condensation protein A [Lachnospiraceae bacterium]|nr:segregation/condensation protein A [Lachnospiraceae bacterium]
MSLSVKLEVFEGPLDLLLHLIEKNKVDIYDIPIAGITDQYLDYVSRMETQDLDVVSDFLVMAATLLDIKSKMLLPPEVNEEGEEQDPREELVARLIEYKMYQYVSGELKDRQVDAQKALYKPPTIPAEVAEYEEPVDVKELLDGLTLRRLNQIFQSVLQRQTDKIDPVRSTFGTIKKEPFRVSVKIGSILTFAGKEKRFSFRQLLERQSDKVEIIVTFLAVLELMKMGHLKVSQENPDSEIELEAVAIEEISAEELEKILENEF